MAPRWKGKGSEVKALANPMSKSISNLQSSLIKSNYEGILSGCSVLLASNPEQTDLLNQTCFGRPIITVDKDKQWFQLTLEEAFYLCYSLKCIKIVGGDHSIKTDDELWEYMTSNRVSFPYFFKAYSHLRVKNWVVRSGCQFGVDFVAYHHHPSLVHSEYGVLVFSGGNENGNDRLRVWSDFQCTLRLCGSVAKTLLILHVNRNGKNVIASSPCIDDYSVEERTITRWNPERCREDQARTKVMGRDIASVRIDKKPSVLKVKADGASHSTNHVSPQPSGESVNVRKSETDKGLHIERSPEKQEAVGVKSTGYEVCSPGGVTAKPEPSKSTEKIMGSPVSPASGSASLEENVATGLHISTNASTFNSSMNTKKSQSSPFFAIRAQKSDTHKYHDEEDNWSVASSAATSRTVRSRVTVGVAPSFRSAQRAAQRKEFYSKLEQKHEALKAEKVEYEARTKEEQEEAIKQMRKNMVVKANPVPSFYRQGPPPKVELKKLPLTRAKSPKLNRRKSCGDTAHASAHEEALCSKVRHSLGTSKPWGANSSPIKQTQGRTTINGISKPKDRTTTKQPNGTPKGSPLKLSKATNSDITVNS